MVYLKIVFMAVKYYSILYGRVIAMGCESIHIYVITFVFQQCPAKYHFSSIKPICDAYEWTFPSFSFVGTSGVFFSFLIHFSMKFMLANRITPAASHLGQFCLPLSHKTARPIWVNENGCGWTQKHSRHTYGFRMCLGSGLP